MKEEITISLPKLGESIVSATVVQWFKKEGDDVCLDEPLLEVSTDKVNSEIPSPIAGKVSKILVAVDDEVQVGDPLAIITLVEVSSEAQEGKTEVLSLKKNEPLSQDSSLMKDFFSPAVLRLCSELGVSLEQLKTIPPTGAGGRITRQDVEAFVANKKSQEALAHKPKPCSLKASTLDEGIAGDVERLKMTGMRKAIADNMVRSFYEAPHATLVNEVDVTDVLKLIADKKEQFLADHGVKLTITSFVAKAISTALLEFPLINSSLEQDTILVKRYVNLGIAVSIDQGLIVPVIKNCQRLSIVEIAKTIADLSLKARTSRLSAQEVSEGTISMTNFGMSGVAIGVPIIRYPEVAIVGVGAIQKRVVVLDNDLMAIRSLMHISLTFDHRVLDGMYGCGFLSAVKKNLEQNLRTD